MFCIRSIMFGTVSNIELRDQQPKVPYCSFWQQICLDSRWYSLLISTTIISAFHFLINNWLRVTRFSIQTKFHIRGPEKVYHCSRFNRTNNKKLSHFANKTTRIRTLARKSSRTKKTIQGIPLSSCVEQKTRGLFHFIISRWFHFLKRQNLVSLFFIFLSLLCYCCCCCCYIHCMVGCTYNTLNISINLHIERETRHERNEFVLFARVDQTRWGHFSLWIWMDDGFFLLVLFFCLLFWIGSFNEIKFFVQKCPAIIWFDSGM